MTVTIRPATRGDIEAFSDIQDKPTVKAWVADLDGRIIAVFGFGLQGGRWMAFCDLTDEARQYKMTIMRAGKRLMDEARQMGIRYVYAGADPNETNSVRWLESLGFKPDPRSGILYRWEA